MTARVSFVGHARTVGVAVLWVVAFAAVAVAIMLVVAALNPVPPSSTWWLPLNAAGELAAFLFATWLVGHRLNGQSWDRMGWHTAGGIWGRMGRGVAQGGGMAALAIALALVGSRATLHLGEGWSGYLRVAGPLGLGLLTAAVAEELAFRGYPLRRLADALGPWLATGVLALGFAIAHLGNPNATFFGVVNVALAAVWLSVAFFSPGGMAYCWGLHFGWNAGLALVFDAPVSGYAFRVPVVEYAPGARTWVDGGAFGPEGGLVATLALVAGTLAIVGARFRRPREWLVA